MKTSIGRGGGLPAPLDSRSRRSGGQLRGRLSESISTMPSSGGVASRQDPGEETLVPPFIRARMIHTSSSRVNTRAPREDETLQLDNPLFFRGSRCYRGPVSGPLNGARPARESRCGGDERDCWRRRSELN